MAGIDLRKACRDCFSQLAGDDVKDALVYLDAGAGEAFHFLGGLSILLAFGPRAVCSLENASSHDAEVQLNTAANGPVQKLLVITTHLLSYAHQHIHRCLQAHNSVKVCTVLTSLSQEAHAAHPNTRLGPDAFYEYRRWLVEDFQMLVQKANIDLTRGTHAEPEDINQKSFEKQEKIPSSNSPEKADCADGNRQPEPEIEEGLADLGVSLDVKVKHFPMIICPLMSRAFVFPSNGTLAEAPLAEKVDSPMGIGLPTELNIPMRTGLPYSDGRAVRLNDEGIPIGGNLLAHFLHHLAGELSLKFDVFTLGALSNDVGKQLTELAGLADVSVRSRKPAGLLLIDRTLDLITPSSHSDSLMDKIFAAACRSNGRDTQKLKTSPMVLKRQPLDIRVSNAVGDTQELMEPCLQSKELCALMSDFEKGGSLQRVIQTTEKKEVNDFQLADGTMAMLCSHGGSLFDSVKNQESGLLDLLLEKRVKDGLFTIEKWLLDAVSQENMKPSSRKGVLSAQDIHLLCNQLSQNLACAVRNADLIQISKAVEMALDPVFNRKWDGLLNAERIISMSVGDPSQSIISQICDVVHQSINEGDSGTVSAPHLQANNLFSLRDALTLAIVGYALAGDNSGSFNSEGPFSREEERELKQAVETAILQGSVKNLGFLDDLEDSLALLRQPKSPEASAVLGHHQVEANEEKDEQDAQVDFNDEGWEAWDDEDEVDTGKGESDDENYKELQLKLQVRDRVEGVFRRLHRVSEARRFLQSKAKTLMQDDYIGFGELRHTRRSLIYKVLSLIFAKADIPGVEHHSSFVGRILKSGFGRFGLGQAKPKLSDNKIILVFVIGGISGLEICDAREVQTIYRMEDEVEVILGGTTFLTPEDIFDLLIGSSTYF